MLFQNGANPNVRMSVGRVQDQASNSWHVEFDVAGDLSADPEYLTHGAKMTCFRAVGFSIFSHKLPSNCDILGDPGAIR